MPASGRAVREKGLRAFTVGQGRVVSRNRISDLSLILGYVLFVSFVPVFVCLNSKDLRTLVQFRKPEI